MKKVIFAVLAALVMSVSFSSCSKSKADQMIDEMEQLVQKYEEVKKSGDQTKALELLSEFGKLSEKYGDLKEEDFTADQKKRIEELAKRFE